MNVELAMIKDTACGASIQRDRREYAINGFTDAPQIQIALGARFEK